MRRKNLLNTGQNRNSINMTPLIDVIFLLMVFFIMTINFNKMDGALSNELPRMGRENTEDKPTDSETVRLKLKMVKGADKLAIHLQERVVYSYEELQFFLDQLPGDTLILLEPGDNIPYKHVIGVYNQCLKSKKKNVVFSLPS